MAIDLFHSLFGVANIGPRCSCKMKGLPLEDSKEYTPFLPNSPEGSPEGAVNNDIASEIGSSTPLRESILPVNPLLSVVQDPHFLRINSSGDIVVEEYIGIPTGLHAESSVDDPFLKVSRLEFWFTLLEFFILAILVLVVLFGELLQDKIFLKNKE